MRGAIPRVPAQRSRALKRLVKSSAAGGSRLMAAFGVYGGLQWTFLFILMNLVFLIAIRVYSFIIKAIPARYHGQVSLWVEHWMIHQVWIMTYPINVRYRTLSFPTLYDRVHPPGHPAAGMLSEEQCTDRCSAYAGRPAIHETMAKTAVLLHAGCSPRGFPDPTG